MHEIMSNKFYLGPKFGTLFNKKWITISELLHKLHEDASPAYKAPHPLSCPFFSHTPHNTPRTITQGLDLALWLSLAGESSIPFGRYTENRWRLTSPAPSSLPCPFPLNLPALLFLTMPPILARSRGARRHHRAQPEHSQERPRPRHRKEPFPPSATPSLVHAEPS
jgi:hypothetical protein